MTLQLMNYQQKKTLIFFTRINLLFNILNSLLQTAERVNQISSTFMYQFLIVVFGHHPHPSADQRLWRYILHGSLHISYYF
jgi:hypothetical protein